MGEVSFIFMALDLAKDIALGRASLEPFEVRSRAAVSLQALGLLLTLSLTIGWLIVVGASLLG